MDSFKLESPIVIRKNTLKAKEELDSSLFTKTSFSKDGYIYEGNTPLNELDLFLDGKICVQGESSQLVSEVLNPQENDTVLDMCAAPGGKTYHMAALMNNKGKIYSNDLYSHRVDLLVKNLHRLGIDIVKPSVDDALNLSKKFKSEYFDKILLDGPCSGLGVIRRKPDILLNINGDKIDELVKLQQALLDQAYILLKKGGKMVYSTCTINKKENDKQIEWFINKYKDMEVISTKTLLPSIEIIDGFFIAELVKKK